MNVAASPHGLTPRLVIAGALTAGSGHLMLWLLMGASANPALFALAGLFAYGGVFAILASRLGTAPAPLLGLVPSSPLAIPAVLLLIPSLLLTSEIDNWVRALFMSESLRELLEQHSAETGLLRTAELILIEVLVFPIALELLFRGIVQPVLVERFGTARGIASTGAVEIGAALLTTLSPYGKLEAFTAALLLGALRHSSGSLLPPLALRALMGAATVAAGHGVFGIPGFDDLEAQHTPAHWLIASALCVGLGLWLCARMERYRQTTGA
jgi:membrane protease YdiL (CAAX protease family)